MRAQRGTTVFEVPAPLPSEGVLRLVAIFDLHELEPSPSLIVIEGIEDGLDPWTLQNVLELLRDASSTVQLLLSTHSPFLLDHVAPEEVVHVRRDRGETNFQPISKLETVAEYERVLAPGA